MKNTALAILGIIFVLSVFFGKCSSDKKELQNLSPVAAPQIITPPAIAPAVPTPIQVSASAQQQICFQPKVDHLVPPVNTLFSEYKKENLKDSIRTVKDEIFGMEYGINFQEEQLALANEPSNIKMIRRNEIKKKKERLENLKTELIKKEAELSAL